MIRSYQRVLTKCMMPAKTKNGPKSLRMQPILWLERGLGLGDGEALLVERAAHDHAAEAGDLEVGERAEGIERAHPSPEDQLAICCPRGLAEGVGIRALHQPP